MNREGLGIFELKTLLASLRLGDQAWGTNVQREFIRLGAAVPNGAISTVLARLSKKGYVEFAEQEPTGKGGKNVKKITVTSDGHRAVATTLKAIKTLTENLQISEPC